MAEPFEKCKSVEEAVKRYGLKQTKDGKFMVEVIGFPFAFAQPFTVKMLEELVKIGKVDYVLAQTYFIGARKMAESFGLLIERIEKPECSGNKSH